MQILLYKLKEYRTEYLSRKQNVFLKLFISYFEREREERKGERERERKRKISSRLCAGSAEPEAELSLTNLEIMT